MNDKKTTPTIEQRGHSMPKPASTPVNNHPQPGAGHTTPKSVPTNTFPSTPPRK